MSGARPPGRARTAADEAEGRPIGPLALPSIPGGDRLVVVVGPSGAGKDSLLRAWRALHPGSPLHFARRAVTREPDAHEGHEAVTAADFAAMRDSGLLATWWQAHGLDYGVRASELAPLAAGAWVVLNGSRAHLPALKTQAPGLRVVEVAASAHLLAQRLAARGREAEPARQARLERRLDAPVAPDLALVNDGELQDGVRRLDDWWHALRRAG